MSSHAGALQLLFCLLFWVRRGNHLHIHYINDHATEEANGRWPLFAEQHIKDIFKEFQQLKMNKSYMTRIIKRHSSAYFTYVSCTTGAKHTAASKENIRNYGPT